MAIQIGKYKRPGIFIEEIDRSIITSPTVDGQFANLVLGFSKKGPVNTAVLLSNLGDLERIFGSLDRQLERKGSFFHRTISKMLEAAPVYAVNLLLTDDALDTIEYNSLSATPIYNNDIKRLAPYRKFFDTTGFWKRDTDTFIDNTKSINGYENRVLNFTNLGDKFITVFVFKSDITGFNRPMLEWYGSIEKLPPYVYPTDLASDYLVDVLVVGGDWSNYAELSVDPRWTRYFSTEGLKKSEVRNFSNDRNITTLGYYEGLSLIPYFRDLNGRNIFVETIINRDTDRTGLFCAFNSDLFETDYPKGLVDLIGNSLVRDELLSNPPTSDETYYQSLDSNDGSSDGEISINFLSYKEQITDTNIFSNRVLDRAGNVIAIFGTNSAVMQNTFTHSFNDSATVSGGVITGPNDDVNLGFVKYPNRTYWFSEGYVNDFYRVDDFQTTSQSVTLEYAVNQTSDNGYAIIGGNYIPLTGTYTVQLSNLDYPQISTQSGTQSYNIAYVIDTQGNVLVKKTTATGSRPTVAATDLVLGWGTVSLYGGIFVTDSVAPTITDITIGLTVSNGAGADAYIPLSYGSDYVITTTSTPQLILNNGDFKVEFLNTNSTPDVKQYEQYRRFKLFNSLLTYINTSNSNRGLMLIDPQSTTEKLSLSSLSVDNVKTGTTINKSFVVRSGLSTSVVNNIVSTGELVFYKIDDEFLIDFYGFETKNTLPLLDINNTESLGVVGRFSNFYTRYNQGFISTKDLFYQNGLYDSVQVQFVQGAGVTASLEGYNYIIFRVDNTRTYSSKNRAFFNKIEEFQGDLENNLSGYSMLIGGFLNSGSFENMVDSGLTVANGLTLPNGPEGSNGGRAELLWSISGGAIDSINNGTFSYYAFEVKETLVDEVINVSKIYGYASGFDDSPLYIRAYQKDNEDLVVNFVDYTLSVESPLNSIEPTNSGLETNGTIYVKSFKDNFKQTIEIEEPNGWIPFPNKILVKRNRYSNIKVDDYLEASYDPTTLASDQMPKKLTRILGKKIWSLDSNYIELSCDSSIKIRVFNGDKQTTRYTKIDDYVTSYKAISLKGFRIREASTPDGTDKKQSEILDIVSKGTTLFKALTNKEAFDFRYLIDSFGLGLTADSKQQLVDICGDRLDAFGILNMPSLKQFKNSISPTFKDENGDLKIEFVAKGGDPESNPEFLYSFGKGDGVTSVGYFLPYVTVDDFGRLTDIPPSAYVGLTFMRKHLSNTTSIVPWTIAAGVNNGRINDILDLEQIFTPSDLEFLNLAQINPLTFKRNRGFVIETNNTAQVLFKSALSLINVREVLIELERELSTMLLDFQWTFNTPEIRSQIKLQADVICEKYVAQNGLFNYFNKIDEENNTPEIIDNQIGVIDTYVEPIKGMGIIVNNITILRTGAISAGGFINS